MYIIPLLSFTTYILYSYYHLQHIYYTVTIYIAKLSLNLTQFQFQFRLRLALFPADPPTHPATHPPGHPPGTVVAKGRRH